MICNFLIPDEIIADIMPDKRIRENNKCDIETILYLIFMTALLREYPDSVNLRKYTLDNMQEITGKAMDAAFNIAMDSIIGGKNENNEA